MKTCNAVFVQGFPAEIPAETVNAFPPSGSCICDSAGTIIRVDDRLAQLLDLESHFADAAQLAGRPFSDLFPDPATGDTFLRLMADRPALCQGRAVKTWAGKDRWLFCERRPLSVEGDGTQVDYRLCDVSACRAEREQRERERVFYSALIENSSAATFVLDPGHRVVIWNKACEELTGIRGEDVIGSTTHWRAFYDDKKQCLADVLIDGDFHRLPGLFSDYSRSKVLTDGWQAEGWFRNRAGEYEYLVFDAVPIRGPDGRLLAVIQSIIDITGHKRAEDALREKDEQLYQLQKMDALGRLAGGVAHDFNNLLMSIMGYGRLVMDALGEEHASRDDLRQVISAAERAASLTQQLLAVGRKQPSETNPLNLNSVVLEMAHLLRRTLGEHIEFEILAEPNLWIVMADSGLIGQIVMNLAVNARDAMSEGGKLVIRTSNVEMGQGYFEGDAEISAGRYVVLTVRDNGSGMPADVQKQMFEPFFTTKEPGHGAGLGLSTAYGIVRQFHGHIEVVTAPNLGTSVMVYFPAVEHPVSRPPSERLVELPKGTETILVVEDEDVLRELVVRTLGSLGYRTLAARDGVEALDVVRLHPDRIDLVLSDVVMPRMGGFDMVRQLRNSRRDFRVLFCSGFTNGALVDGGLIDGTEEVILKPYTSENLARKIRQILDGA